MRTEKHTSVIDPLNVPAQLDSLHNMKDGWLEGEGLAPDHAGLDWLSAKFDRKYPDNLPPPYIYPTIDGGIQAEWSIAQNEISLEVNLASHAGEWHRLNLETEKDDTKTLNLDDNGDWNWLIAAVQDSRMRSNEK